MATQHTPMALRERSFRHDRRGVVAIVTAISMVPLFVAIGVGIDMSRLSMAKTALQMAADDAALAGAAAYQTPTSGPAAKTVATTYYNRAVGMQGGLLSNPTASVTTVAGAYSSSIQGYNVTVAATATLKTTFLSLASIATVAVTASATASNPIVQPIISAGFRGSSAADWNSVFMYGVPMLSNGNPDFAHYPAFNQWYEISSNCSASGSTSYQTNAQCKSWPGAVVPSNQTFPTVTATQPLAFVMFNMTHGLIAPGEVNYTNQYGAIPGDMHFQATALMAFNMGPAGLSDNADPYVNQFFPTVSRKANVATHYSDVNNSATPNCGLLIQVVDPNNLPSTPPVPGGSCYALNNTAAGLQYANLSCSQMAGRTFLYWFNDMGGGTDDKDYNDLYFSVRCVPSPSSPNGGLLYSSNAPNLTVALIR